MKFKYECLWCHVNQAKRIAELVGMDDIRTEGMVRKVLKHLSEMPYEGTNPAMMEETWRIITQEVGDDNPYKAIKASFNQEMLTVYDRLHQKLLMDEDRFHQGIHLAIEGNIIDFGAKHEFSIEATVKQLLASEWVELAIDESEVLYEQLKGAEQVLYIGDNCGEIVMDKLLIQILKKEFPKLRTSFSVRGKPILNDVTIEDAIQVGMSEVADVIDSGSGAPGTVLSLTSDKFKQAFDAADVIIAKGQGNFESLSHLKKDKLFFLFMGKCDAVAKDIGVPLMSKMCTRSY